MMRSALGWLAAAAVTIGVSAAPARAMEIAAYDQLSLNDKTRYVVLLLEGAKTFLTESGKSAEAQKVGKAFSITEPGEDMPHGMRQFGDDLQSARNLARKTGKALHVEHALLLTFRKLKIEGVGAEMMKFGDGFKPSTTTSK